MKHHTRIACLLIACGALTASAWDGATDDTTWNNLKNNAQSKRTELVNKISQAKTQGINTDYAYVTQVTIDRFLTYAQWDRNNQNTVQQKVDDVWWKHIFPTDYATDLPFDELQACIDIANNAITELNSQMNGSLKLKSPVDFSQGDVKRENGEFRIDGRPVYPSSFIFMPYSTDLWDAFGRIGGWYYPLSELQSDGSVYSWSISGDVDTLNAQNDANLAPHISFLGYNLSDWMKTQEPNIEKGRREFIGWDIDNPKIQTWYTQFVSGAFPQVCAASGDTPRIHLLGNEPHMAMREKGWAVKYGVSEYTKDKWQNWLQNKYGNDLSKLNDAHKINYASFTDARNKFPFDTSNSDPTQWGVPLNLQGGPVWYDVMRFNMDRVNEWWKFLSDTSNANDPADSPSTVKILGGAMLDTYRDGGIDIEYLADVQGVMGSDFTLQPITASQYDNSTFDWESRYTMDWIQQTMGLDFYKSLYPNKPFFDSEWHGIDGRWKDLNMREEYIRAALWIGFTHGFNMIDAWAWGRNDDGSPTGKTSFVGELLTQPKILNSYGRTMKELNAHAESISTLVPANRKFYIYYCEDSAIQDTTYMVKMQKTYEALKMLNVQVGFTTSRKLGSLGTDKVLVIPPTPYISYSNMQAIKNFGGKKVLIEDTDTLKKSEYGVIRSDTNVAANYTVAQNSDIYTFANNFKSKIGSIIPALPIPLSIKTTGNADTYGVLTQQRQSGTETIVFLINLSQWDRVVTLSGGAVNDLITGKSGSTTMTLKPYDIKLLSVSSSTGAPIGSTIALKAAVNGKYVCADQYLDSVNWVLAANRTAVGAWEKFVVVDAGGGLIALKANANNKYVCADQYLDAANWKLAANRTAIGAWEKFTWIANSDGTVSLKANGNGKYVCADAALNGTVPPLVANRTAIGAWEKFTVETQ